MDFHQAFRNRKTFSIRVTGESMYPLFRSGDIVFLRHTTLQKVKIDDLILVHHGGRWFIHRAAYKKRGILVTQGDNNQQTDGVIGRGEVYAVVYRIIRNKKEYAVTDIYRSQSVLYQGEIDKLQRHFRKEGVAYLFLKGLPLYRYYFKSVPRRFLSDCDLLVLRADAGRIDRVFQALGYERETDYPSASFLWYRRQPQTEIGYARFLNGLPVVFDVHYEITPKSTHFPSLRKRLAGATDRLLDGHRLISLDKQVYPILGENELILYQILHLTNHFWGGHYRYDMLMQILKLHRRTDWPAVFRMAKSQGVINYIYPPLAVLDRWYGVKLPFEVYKKNYSSNYRYTRLLLYLFIDSTTAASFNMFRWEKTDRINKFLIRFLLYDRPLLSKISELLRENFLGYLGRLLITRIRRSPGSNGTGQRTAGPQA